MTAMDKSHRKNLTRCVTLLSVNFKLEASAILGCYAAWVDAWLSTTGLSRITSQKSGGGGSLIISNWPNKYWTCASNLRFVKQLIQLRPIPGFIFCWNEGKFDSNCEVNGTPCVVSLHTLRASLAIITVLDVVTVWRIWRQLCRDSCLPYFVADTDAPFQSA
jgi:hypothetical protein